MTTEELYDKEVCPDLEVDGPVLLSMIRAAVAEVPPYTSQYAVLREQVQNGLLTEREHSLTEEGRII